ncbi:MAG: hypothetical protein COY42_27240 [Armatimonadetes bacterium CG_4_10_14_0_8_um_filter_66_14]|nr:hypothetical protein [Armatimonadota bacterium]OIP02898.1 MAG: hypothetical protein AUJ96_15520 [Armatimonadetes bacterium CG2_30_66_41]PIX46063.1 MAG: hypothetical protein COZ57_13810 [Armatimonadetes bacterium CG_4_8_14_3_um_filter_66_20]PIZ35194.1 MAG: hypothetical protein COY42_27240 [Armatimonadetes bacterium CG_4_10_14_0_8_um_filter_66_14]
MFAFTSRYCTTATGRRAGAALLVAGLATAAAAQQPAAPDSPPLVRPAPKQFLWGFCQVCSGTWPLSDEEMARTVKDLGVNAIRLFVPPAWVGFPQKTWQGPESIDYTKTPADELVWDRPSPEIDSLDEVIAQLRRFGIHPLVMPLFVTPYTDYLYKDDLTFLNDPDNKVGGQPSPVDFTGIKPLEQVLYLARAVARHLHEKFGDDFTMIFDEVRGGNPEPPAAHVGEQERWAQVVAALKQEAPGCTVFSPELCVGMWWWPTALKNDGEVAGKLLEYNEQWPRGDRIENYAASFDALAISFFEIGVREWLKFAPTRTFVQANADVPLHVTRDHCRPKQWFWGEAPWGSCEALALQRTWTGVFFGTDNCRGLLSWQLKDHEGSGSGVIQKDGKLADTYPAAQQFARVVCEESRFLATYHGAVNADGFPVARDDQFVEEDRDVMTRLLGQHLVVFNCGSRRTDLLLRNPQGCTLQPVVQPGWPHSLKIEHRGDEAVLSGVIPSHLYLLRLLPPSPGE